MNSLKQRTILESQNQNQKTHQSTIARSAMVKISMHAVLYVG